MGFWKGFSDVAMNVITLGGHSAVQDSNDLYDRRLREHRTSVKQFERARSTFHKAVEELGEETAAAIAMIEVAQDFVQRLSYDEVSSALPNVPRFTPPDLSDVNRLITDFNAAVEAGKTELSHGRSEIPEGVHAGWGNGRARADHVAR